jgi:hypothetical protein
VNTTRNPQGEATTPVRVCAGNTTKSMQQLGATSPHDYEGLLSKSASDGRRKTDAQHPLDNTSGVIPYFVISERSCTDGTFDPACAAVRVGMASTSPVHVLVDRPLFGLHGPSIRTYALHRREPAKS